MPLLVLSILVCSQAPAAELAPELPPPLANDEAALLAAAQAVEAEVLEGGYRQFDLTAAQVSTWEGSKELQLRLWLPPEGDHAGPYPVIAYVHGGGFIGGNFSANLLDDRRRGFAENWRAALDSGFAVTSLSYRLAREGGWPAPVSDPLAQLRFLRDHAAHWNLDAQRFGVHGHSAGARSAALLGMVPQDGFHVGELPWQGDPVTIAAIYMWAGGALTAPELKDFLYFGRPRQFSVLRLHHGEHPAWTDSSRHSMRIRNNWPHLSTALPPLRMVRGDRDYGGDHSDAEGAVAVWQALGIEAALAVVPGGHNASEDPEEFVAFFRRHLVDEPFKPGPRQALPAAQAVLAAGHAAGALEILSAHHTAANGHDVPPGAWMFLSDGSMHWLPEHEGWPAEHQAVAEAARSSLAAQEIAAARNFAARLDWLRALEAARLARRLTGSDEDLRGLAQAIEDAAGHERQVLQALQQANELLHAGDPAAARARLAEVDDPRLVEADDMLSEELPSAPAWAAGIGSDLYGIWARLELSDGVSLRLRWVAPGDWQLPEHLHYRNSVDDPFTSQIEVAHGFWLAETPVTLAQWRAARGQDLGDIDPQRAESPVTRIDWLQIVDWLDALSEQHADLLARLPSEEEWMFAATAGGRKDAYASMDLHAVHALNVDPEQPGPGPVGRTLPNLAGLSGMVGGVWEWTASPDRRVARFNDDSGRLRIIAYPQARGGAWSSMPHSLGVDTRAFQRHANRSEDLGFRLVIGGGPDVVNWRDAVIQR